MSIHESAVAPHYAELHAMSNFSFLHGASHPEELVERACALGYEALAITDHGTLAGIVRAHGAARQTRLVRPDFRLVIGAYLEPVDAAPLVVWVADRTGYANLCRLLTLGAAQGAAQGASRGAVQTVAPAVGPGGPDRNTGTWSLGRTPGVKLIIIMMIGSAASSA